MTKPALRTGADFDAFYEKNWLFVYRLCFTYLKSEADAEDCAEDVFVKVLTGGMTFTDETHERKWLTVAAANLCKDRLKSRARKAAVSADDAADVPAKDMTDHSDVRDAVLALPDKYKDVVWLYYYCGYQTDEIARALKCPASTVRNRLKDARTKLEPLLKGEF